MNKRSLWIIIGGVIIAILVIVGILITQKPTPKEKVVKIGAVLPLTGAAADIGQKAKRGLEIAEKELKIKVIYEDSGSDPKQGLSAFRKLITTERDLVGVISMLSGVGNAIIPIAETEKVVTLHIASAPEMVTGKKFSFRWYITSKEQMKAVVKYLHQQNVSEKSRIAFLFINDEYGRGALKEFTESFKEQFGVEPNLVSEAYEKEQTDFKNILVKLKTFNPEILAIVGYNKSLGILLKQMREQKIEPRILTGDDAISYPEILQVAGNAADGFVFPGLPLEPKEGEQVSQFFQIYKEQFNEPVSDFALFAYGMAHMFYHCVINGAKTSEEIANCLETNVFSTPIGEVSFNRETHDGNVPLRMKEIKGGEVIEHK